MSTDAAAVLILLVLVALAVVAPRFGTDTRASREWTDEHPLPRPGRHP